MNLHTRPRRFLIAGLALAGLCGALTACSSPSASSALIDVTALPAGNTDGYKIDAKVTIADANDAQPLWKVQPAGSFDELAGSFGVKLTEQNGTAEGSPRVWTGDGVSLAVQPSGEWRFNGAAPTSCDPADKTAKNKTAGCADPAAELSDKDKKAMNDRATRVFRAGGLSSGEAAVVYANGAGAGFSAPFTAESSPTPLSFWISFTGSGDIITAYGVAGNVARAGKLATVAPAAAIGRLQAHDGPAITLNAVSRVVVPFTDAAGRLWLLPGYRFTDTDGNSYDTQALPDSTFRVGKPAPAGQSS